MIKVKKKQPTPPPPPPPVEVVITTDIESARLIKASLERVFVFAETSTRPRLQEMIDAIFKAGVSVLDSPEATLLRDRTR